MSKFWEQYLDYENRKNSVEPSEERKYIHEKAVAIQNELEERKAMYDAIVAENPDLSLRGTIFARLGPVLMEPSEDAWDKNLKLLASLHTRQGQKDFAVKTMIAARKMNAAAPMSERECVDFYRDHISDVWCTFTINDFMKPLADKGIISQDLFNLYDSNKTVYQGNMSMAPAELLASDKYLYIEDDLEPKEYADVMQDLYASHEDILKTQEGKALENYLGSYRQQYEMYTKFNEYLIDTFATLGKDQCPDEIKLSQVKEVNDVTVWEDINLSKAADLIDTKPDRTDIRAFKKTSGEVRDIRNLLDSELSKDVSFSAQYYMKLAKDTFEKLDKADYSSLNIFQKSSPQYTAMKDSAEDFYKLCKDLSKDKEITYAASAHMLKDAMEEFIENTGKYLAYKTEDIQKTGDVNNSRYALAKDILNDFVAGSHLAELSDELKFVDMEKDFEAEIEFERSDNEKENRETSRRNAVSAIRKYIYTRFRDSLNKEYRIEERDELEYMFENHSRLMDEVLSSIVNRGKNAGNYHNDEIEICANALMNEKNPLHEEYTEYVNKLLKDIPEKIYREGTANTKNRDREYDFGGDELMKIAYDVRNVLEETKFEFRFDGVSFK